MADAPPDLADVVREFLRLTSPAYHEEWKEGRHPYPDVDLAVARTRAAKALEAAQAPDVIAVLRALTEMADEKVTIRRTHEIASMARAALEKAGVIP